MDSGPDLSALISSVLQNPEITSIISSLSAGGTDSSEAPSQDKSNESGTPVSIPPEILAKLPQMMSALSGISKSAPSGVSSPLSSDKDNRRSALLKALRPYMSDRRQTVIDGMLRMESIAKVLGTMKDT